MTESCGNQPNLKILEAIVENTEMGKNTLEQMIPLAQEPLFKAELMREKLRYHELNSEAHRCIASCGGQAKGQSAFAKVNTRMAISMKTMHDKSTRNMAQMISQGCHQGVIDCIEQKKDYPNAASGTQILCDNLQSFEQDCIDRMKTFL